MQTYYFIFRYTFTVFSNILVYCVTWAVLHITSESDGAQIGPGDVSKFQNIVAIGLSIGFTTSMIFHIFVHETPPNVSSGKTKIN